MPLKHKQVWLGGWGISPESIGVRLKEALPHAEITVLPPCRASLEFALTTPEDTALGGWSLGARLLLDAVAEGKISPGRRLLLICPFLGFPSESGQGGRASATQVKVLRRWLSKDPAAALDDFYRRAGLDLPAPTTLPYSAADLEEGLAILADTAPKSEICIPPGARVLAGANDPLVDNTRLAELLPGLRILPDARHDLTSFVKEIAADA